MAQGQHFPVELIELIFKALSKNCQTFLHAGLYDKYDAEHDVTMDQSGEAEDDDECAVFQLESRWNDESIDSPAKFPFNIARVCRLWRDIALLTPMYWVSIAFDLGEDPQPLLGAFSASRDLSISVFVFNSNLNEETDETRTLEHHRSRRVVQHLLPHTNRCTSIVFRVIFSSSVPSPRLFLSQNPLHLDELRLDYQVYDGPECLQGVHIDPKPGPYPLTDLRILAMNGAAFMDILPLAMQHIGWRYADERYGPMDDLQLLLYDLHFPDPRHSSVANRYYTFENFVYLLHLFSPEDLQMVQCTLDYDPTDEPRSLDEEDELYMNGSSWDNIGFDSVSRGFITEFFNVAGPGVCYATDSIKFKSCLIPPISLSHGFHEIILEDIPTSYTPFLKDNSIYNVITQWNERVGISVESCPSFNDDLLRWLAGDNSDGECQAHDIQIIEIYDCQNFTPHAMRELVDAINRLHQKRIEQHDSNVLISLTVSGLGPLLDEEDIAWFKTNNGITAANIEWKTRNERGEGNDIKILGSSYIDY